MTTDLTIQTVARLLYKKFFLLIIFGAFGLMLSSLYIINSDKEYISYFMFKVNYPVKEEVLELLEEKFRDEDIFSKWALEKNPKIISYDEFKSEMNVKSLSFYKERKNLKVDKKSNFFYRLLVKKNLERSYMESFYSDEFKFENVKLFKRVKSINNLEKYSHIIYNYSSKKTVQKLKKQIKNTKSPKIINISNIKNKIFGNLSNDLFYEKNFLIK